MMNTSCDFSGERFIPGVKGDIELEHLHRYYAAEILTRGKVVADIACGEGYGSFILAETAERVIGIDLSHEAVERARRKYVNANLEFIVADAIKTPLPDNSVDIVVSFETIEHHSFHEEMMAEIVRILKPNGFLIMSSPDKYECTDKTGRINQFHVKELYKNEFVALLGRFFSSVSLYGQRVQISSIIDGVVDQNDRVLGSYRLDQKNKNLQSSLVPDPMFWVALASNSTLPRLGTSALVDPTDVEVLRGVADRSVDLENFVAHQAGDIVQLNASIKKLTTTHEQEIQSLLEHDAERLRFVDHLERDIVVLREALRTSGDERLAQQKQVEQLRLEIDRLSLSLREESSRLALAKEKVTSLSSRLNEVQASFSWRLTAPLRFLRRLIQNH